ncbi:iron-sulfur cluster assembly scaffold protein [Candidatus Woesearchaeota archaeon]|nr:iron-sulfur cluster assembly scaffold protein [Candidatus Woesearchaeota archaeon]
MYSKKVLQRFQKPKFAKKMKDPSSKGKVGNTKCGDIMEIFIKVKTDKNGDEIIKDISFLTYGCVAAIASTDYLCEIAKGKTLEKALKITSKDVVKKMGSVPAIKLHCSVLAQKALKEAIEEYKNKKEK